MMFVGRTALSVLTRTNRSTPPRNASCANVKRSNDVVAKTFEWIVLDQGNMFIGSSMKNHGGLPCFHDRPHPPPVENGREQRDRNPTCSSIQSVVDRIKGVFARLYQQQLGRFHPIELAAQFAPDRPTRSGNHYHPVANTPLQRITVVSHGFATQKVIDREIPKIAGLDCSMSKIHETRKRTNARFMALKCRDNSVAACA